MNGGINLKDTKEIQCENCQSTLFTEATMLRRVSRLLTGQAKDAVLPIPVFSCLSCEHVNQEFIPNELKEENGSNNIISY